jgi:hypothetical protein
VPNTKTKNDTPKAQKGGKSPGKEAVLDDFKKMCRYFNFLFLTNAKISPLK